MSGKARNRNPMLVRPRNPSGESRAAWNDRRKIELQAAQQARDSLLREATSAPAIARDITSAHDRRVLERERDILTAALREEERELALRDFWFFLTGILFPDVWKAHYHPVFHGEIGRILQNLPPGSNHLFVLPREARKSYLVCCAFVLWNIVRNPNIRIMLVGAKEKTVKKWSLLVRSAFIPGTQAFGKFQQVFSDFVFKERESSTPLQALEWSVQNRTVALPDATFFATYLGVTGAGGRANLQIFDDPYERRNVSNPVQSMKALEQTMDLFPLVEMSEAAPLRQRIFNMTRWAYHDPTGTFLGERHEDLATEMPELDGLPEFRAMVRHSFEDPKRPCEVCPASVTRLYPHGHPDVENGEAILAPLFTRDMLMKRYREYCADPNKGESLWYHQYQNVCLAPSAQRFKPEWIITAPFPYFDLPKARVLAFDSADKDFASEGLGDYMVALFGEFDDYGRLLLPYGLRSNKWTRAEFIQRIVTWCRGTGWWPHKVVKEQFGTDKSILTDIDHALLAQQKPAHCLIVPRPGASGSAGSAVFKKHDWIVATLQGPMERAEVIFGRDFPVELRRRAEYELTNLGQTKNDDVADCLALFFAERVRPTPSAGHGVPQETWQPPDLSLYTPGFYPTPSMPQQTPLQQAMRTQTAALEAQLGPFREPSAAPTLLFGVDT